MKGNSIEDAKEKIQSSSLKKQESSLIHLHAMPNPYYFISSIKPKRRSLAERSCPFVFGV